MLEFKLLFNGQQYDLSEYVPDYYVTFADNSNAALHELRKGIPTWLPEEIYRKMNVSVWVDNNLSVNAFACYKEGNNYIVLTAGLFYEFWKNVDEFVDHENFSKVFKLSAENKQHLKNTLFFFMLNFALAHEFGHIAYGHLMEANSGNCICEAFDKDGSKNNKSKNWATQLKEYAADSFAVMLQSALFVQRWTSDIKANLSIFDRMYLSNYLCFRVFAEKAGRNFDEYMSKEIDEIDHPHPGIRMYYSNILFAYWLGRFIGYDADTLSIISSGIDAVISYEKNVLEKPEIKSSYYSVAYTEKGSQHVKHLHNQWQALVDYYNTIAYFPFEKMEEIDNLPFMLNMVGKPILKE